MKRNYTWRLNGKRWQKVVRTPVNMTNTSVSSMTAAYNVVASWLHITYGPKVP